MKVTETCLIKPTCLKNNPQILQENREFEALPSEEQRYIDIQKDKILLIGTPERFINHSCEANTKPGILCDIALRDIKIGEEITTDYSNFYIPLGPFQCNCNSKNCRRYIQGTSIK